MKVLLKYGSERITINEAARRVGISGTAMRFRVYQGWPKEKLFERPKPSYIREKKKASAEEPAPSVTVVIKPPRAEAPPVAVDLPPVPVSERPPSDVVKLSLPPKHKKRVVTPLVVYPPVMAGKLGDRKGVRPLSTLRAIERVAGTEFLAAAAGLLSGEEYMKLSSSKADRYGR